MDLDSILAPFCQQIDTILYDFETRNCSHKMFLMIIAPPHVDTRFHTFGIVFIFVGLVCEKYLNEINATNEDS